MKKTIDVSKCFNTFVIPIQSSQWIFFRTKTSKHLDISIKLQRYDSLTQITLTDSLVANAPIAIPSENELYGQALGQRPDLQALVLQQQVSEQQRVLAKAARLPVVSAVGQYQLQTQARKFDFVTNTA